MNVTEYERKDTSLFQCSDGKMIETVYVGDLVPDCSDDESYIGFGITHSGPEMNQSGLGMSQSDKCSELQMSCFPSSKCYDIRFMCQYDLDHNNQIITCRNGFHLENCENSICTNSYKCYMSYCIPYRRVCDGVYDCIHRDDEDFCEQHLCKFMLKCRSIQMMYTCVHPIEVCDGVRHCLHGEDELLCDLKPCPAGCQCLGLAMHCLFTNIVSLTFISPHLQYLAIVDSNMSMQYLTFTSTPIIQELTLSKNKMDSKSICNKGLQRESLFFGLRLLRKLDLSYNRISTISGVCVLNNAFLKYLNVSHNIITSIDKKAFTVIVELEILDISFNKIKSFDADAFSRLSDLQYVNVRHNPIAAVIVDSTFVFKALASDTGSLCCAVKVKACLTSVANYYLA